MATVPFLHGAPSTITRCIHGWKGLDREAFRTALMEFPVIADPSSLAALILEEAFMHYKAAVGGVIDRLLPMHVVIICQCPSSPWFDKECCTLRRQACRHEFRRTRMPSDRSTWVQFVRNMHRKYREKERAYWEDKIISHAKEHKRLWSTFNTLLGRRQVQPECISGAPAFTAEDFLTSHTAKILGIRQATEGSPTPHHPSTDCSIYHPS